MVLWRGLADCRTARPARVISIAGAVFAMPLPLGSDTLSAADSVAHVIQVALTPVFLLSGIASLLGVFSGRLARVADRVDQLAEKLETADLGEKGRLSRRLSHLRRRSRTLDVAVLLGTAGGSATCAAALALFIGTLRDSSGGILMFAAFGLALVCTAGALSAFALEMLMASRGLRDEVAVHRREAQREGPIDAEPEAPGDEAADACPPPGSSG